MTLTHSPSEILQTYLVAQGLGVLPSEPAQPTDWPIFCSYMPPEGPEQAACIYDTAATEDGRLMATGAGIHHPGIQIMVRAQDWPVVYSKASEFHLTLEDILNALVVMSDSSTYNLRNAANVKLPLRIGQEIGKNRMLASVNAILTIDEFMT